jgi:hypothetical protein
MNLKHNYPSCLVGRQGRAKNWSGLFIWAYKVVKLRMVDRNLGKGPERWFNLSCLSSTQNPIHSPQIAPKSPLHTPKDCESAADVCLCACVCVCVCVLSWNGNRVRRWRLQWIDVVLEWFCLQGSEAFQVGESGRDGSLEWIVGEVQVKQFCQVSKLHW